jgi:hypothetical protein
MAGGATVRRRMPVDLPNTEELDGTLVPPNEAAIITDNDSLQLLMPKYVGNAELNNTEEAPRELWFLFACFIRAHADPDFVDDVIAWHDAYAGEMMKAKLKAN